MLSFLFWLVVAFLFLALVARHLVRRFLLPLVFFLKVVRWLIGRIFR